MKRLIYILMTLCAVAFNAAAQDIASANAMYAAGDYEGALTAYEAVVSVGMESSDLYYNMGNCCYRLDRLAPSILWYERALRLNPDNADARHNLEFARLRTIDRINTPEKIFYEQWWITLRNLMGSDGWAILSVVLFILLLASLSAYLFTRPMWLRKSGFSVAVISLVLFLVTTLLASQQKRIATATNEAIIYAQTVTVKSTPDNSGTELFILHEGTKVNVGQKVGEWIEISTEEGNSGWLPASSIEII